VISLGPAPIDIPNVVGQPQATAESTIVGAGLIVGAVTTANSGSVPAGNVISQSPAACTGCATSGSPVDLVISLGPAPIDVPNVVGQPQASAESTIVGAGLTVGAVTTANSGSVPAGNVVSQSPAACSGCATSGSPVDLVISLGPAPIDIPDVVGQPQASAESTVVGAGLTVGAVTTANSGTVPAGNVISQSPAACTGCATSGSPVDLVISLGPAIVDVPNVVGQPQASAESTIVGAGLTVGAVTSANSETVAAGNVISQSPTACAICATAGSPVDLVISLGPAPIDVPNVVGQPQATAESAIIAAGLSVGSVTTATSPTVPAGSVISQSPGACSACVAPTSPVDLVISSGPPNDAPVVNITGPAENTIASETTAVTFTGTASDTEDGVLSGSLVWSSNKDGVLGTGASVTTTLSKGKHTITATVTDSEGSSGTDTVGVRIRKQR